MSGIDLFKRAEENAINIDRKYGAIENKPGVANFTNHVQSEARVSINRKARPLIHLLKDNEMVSGYRDYETKKESHELRDFYAYLRWRWTNVERARKYIRRRFAFFQECAQGEYHQFGALNCGSAGTAAAKGLYGYYCIVLKEDRITLGSIAYCKRDTLDFDDYWTCDAKKLGTSCPCNKALEDLRCSVDVDVLCENYAPHSHRGRLAALKHENTLVEGLNRAQIAKILIKRYDSEEKRFNEDRTEEYIEACFVIPITRYSIQEVRIHVGLAFRIMEEALMDPDDPDSGESFMHQHNDVLKLLKRQNIAYSMDS